MNRLSTIAVACCLCICEICQSAESSSSVLSVATEIGISPESLIVSDLRTHAASILLRIEENDEQRDLLEQQRVQESTLEMELSQLAISRSVRPHDEVVREAERQKVQAITTVREQISQTLDSLFDDATDGLTTEQVAGLQSWRRSSAFPVPPEYRALDRTTDQWRVIVKSLRAVNRHVIQPVLEEDPDYIAYLADCQARISAIQAESDVVESRVNLQNYLGEVHTIFASYESEPTPEE